MAKENPFAGLKYVEDQPVVSAMPGNPFAGLKYVEDEPETYSPIETVGRNAVNVFGLAAPVSGVVQKLLNNRPYEEGRDETRRHLEESNEQNPISSYVGKAAALIPETLIGGAASKAVQLGSKAVGATELLSPVLQKLGSTGTAIAKGALGGAGYGAAGGAGEALSKGEDVLPAAAESALTGGLIGGALGGVAHKVGEAFEGAIGKQNESIVRGASERALPRKQSALAAIIEDELPKTKTNITAGDVLQDNVKILKGLRSGDYETVAKASEDVQRKVSSLEVGKAENYKTVDKALKGGFEAKGPIDALENRAATENEAPWKNVLLNKAKNLREQWSSISTDEAKRYLTSMRVTGDQSIRDALEGLASKLPEGKTWTKSDFLDHLAGGERGSAAKTWADLNPDLRRAVEQLPFKFDGTLKIPSQDLRRLLTLSQDEAETALGTLNATKNARLASLGQEVLGTTLDRTLDAAAAAGEKGVEKAVQAIRDVNVQQSVLLKLNEAVSKKIEKLQLGKPTLGGIAGHGAADLLGGYELLGAGRHLLHGDLAGAAQDAALAVAAKLAPKAIVGAKRGVIDSMAALKRAVDAGNPNAIRLLKAVQASQKLGTAAAGSVGAVTAGTLGGQ